MKPADRHQGSYGCTPMKRAASSEPWTSTVLKLFPEKVDRDFFLEEHNIFLAPGPLRLHPFNSVRSARHLTPFPSPRALGIRHYRLNAGKYHEGEEVHLTIGS